MKSFFSFILVAVIAVSGLSVNASFLDATFWTSWSTTPDTGALIDAVFAPSSSYTSGWSTQCTPGSISVVRLTPADVFPQIIPANTIYVLDAGDYTLPYVNNAPSAPVQTVSFAGPCSAILGNGNVTLTTSGYIQAGYAEHVDAINYTNYNTRKGMINITTDRIVIDGVIIDAGDVARGQNHVGLSITNTRDVTVHNASTNNALFYGTYIYNTDTVTLIDMMGAGNYNDTKFMYGGAPAKVGTAIEIHDARGTLVKNPTLNANGVGFEIRGESANLIPNNNTLIGGVITNSANHAIWLDDYQTNTIVDGTTVRGGVNGVLVKSNPQPRAVGNNITLTNMNVQDTSFGIMIYGGHNVAVNNVFVANNSVGINVSQLAHGSNFSINNSVVTNNIDGIQIVRNGQTLVNNTLIANNTRGLTLSMGSAKFSNMMYVNNDQAIVVNGDNNVASGTQTFIANATNVSGVVDGTLGTKIDISAATLTFATGSMNCNYTITPFVGYDFGTRCDRVGYFAGTNVFDRDTFTYGIAIPTQVQPIDSTQTAIPTLSFNPNYQLASDYDVSTLDTQITTHTLTPNTFNTCSGSPVSSTIDYVIAGGARTFTPIQDVTIVASLGSSQVINVTTGQNTGSHTQTFGTTIPPSSFATGAYPVTWTISIPNVADTNTGNNTDEKTLTITSTCGAPAPIVITACRITDAAKPGQFMPALVTSKSVWNMWTLSPLPGDGIYASIPGNDPRMLYYPQAGVTPLGRQYAKWTTDPLNVSYIDFSEGPLATAKNITIDSSTVACSDMLTIVTNPGFTKPPFANTGVASLFEILGGYEITAQSCKTADNYMQVTFNVPVDTLVGLTGTTKLTGPTFVDTLYTFTGKVLKVTSDTLGATYPSIEIKHQKIPGIPSAGSQSIIGNSSLPSCP